MNLIHTISDMHEYIRDAKNSGTVLGLVPTMGYLHKGHISLVQSAKEECGTVVMSIFVNPAQFGPGEDFEKYPRDICRDSSLAEKAGVDVIFAPATEEIYPAGTSTYVDVGDVSEGLCGRSRPGHFRGVATVVNKLFNVVMPDKAYFGQKDAQQVAVIKRMVRDLGMAVDIRVVPTVREPDGLAMSSRNGYLSVEERKHATVLYRALILARSLAVGGDNKTASIKEMVRELIEKEKDSRVDYVEIVDADTMHPVETVGANTIVVLAVFIGSTRLIDNMKLVPDGLLQ